MGRGKLADLKGAHEELDERVDVGVVRWNTAVPLARYLADDCAVNHDLDDDALNALTSMHGKDIVYAVPSHPASKRCPIQVTCEPGGSYSRKKLFPRPRIKLSARGSYDQKWTVRLNASHEVRRDRCLKHGWLTTDVRYIRIRFLRPFGSLSADGALSLLTDENRIADFRMDNAVPVQRQKICRLLFPHDMAIPLTSNARDMFLA